MFIMRRDPALLGGDLMIFPPPWLPFSPKGSPRATFHKEKFYGRKIMKDAIDKRNDRERIARSIVKRRNIVYTSQAELDRRRQEEAQKLKQDRTEAAEQLVKQFKDEAKKKQAMEIERLLAEQAMLEKQLETGMDATGKKLMDDVTQERVEAILSEKSKQLESIISANAVQVEQKLRSTLYRLLKIAVWMVKQMVSRAFPRKKPVVCRKKV